MLVASAPSLVGMHGAVTNVIAGALSGGLEVTCGGVQGFGTCGGSVARSPPICIGSLTPCFMVTTTGWTCADYQSWGMEPRVLPLQTRYGSL
jgi:hypothetical protein